MFKKIFLVLTIIFFLAVSPVRAVKYGEGKYGVGAYSVTDMPTLPPGSNNSTAVSNEKCNDSVPGPKAPWLYGATPESSDSVLLYFTAADNPVSKYVLEYGTKSGDYKYGVSDMGINSRDQMTFLIKSLGATTTYYFKVRAGNGCATGTWSNEISSQTKGLFSFNQLETTNLELETIPLRSQDYKNQDSKIPRPQKTLVRENSYVVKIKVADTNKKPVVGAKVTIHSKVQEKVTDKNGIAKFENVEKGEHKILIAYNNFSGEQTVNLTGNVKEFDLNVSVKEEKIAFSRQAKIIIGVLLLIVIGLVVLLIKKSHSTSS